MRERKADVVIVGARCAGAAVGRLLAKSGLDVVLVDRAGFPSDTVSTHSIAAHGSRLLEHWGLRDRLLETGVPNPRTIGITVGALDLPETSTSDLGSLSPRRTVLDALLVEAARAAGAEVWEHAPVRSLLWEEGAVSGVRCGTTGAEVDVRARLVIGADGRHSFVARAVEAAWYDVRPSNLGGVYAYYANTGLAQNELAIGVSNVTLAFVTHEDLVCVAVGTNDERARAVAAGGDEAVRAIARRSSPRVAAALERARRVGRFTAYRAEPGRFVQPFGPGWALVGDAGHYKDPFSGQGIADAFLSAQLLHDALVDGLGGVRPLEQSMRAYQSLRDAASARMHDVTARLASMSWSEEEVVQLVLDYRDAAAAAYSSVTAYLSRTPVAAQDAGDVGERNRLASVES